MEKRPFGKTGLDVSVVGFGGAPIGFLETEQRQVGDVLNGLLDRGVNLIDTAAMYLGSEQAIGKAIGHRRGEFVLVSKCGAGWDTPGDSDWSAAGIRKYIDRSLQRLNFDVIDVMLLHSCDLATLQKGEALGAVIEARDAGKVRFVGYSGDNDAAAHAVTLPDVAVLETSVNICDQANIDAALPGAREHDVGVLAKRPVANAAWKKLDQQPGMYSSYARDYTERLAAMKLTPADLGFEGDPETVWPEIALRFTLSQPGVTTAIIGTTNPRNVEANLVAAGEGPLSDDVVEKLRKAFRDAQAASGSTWPGLT